VTAPYRLVSWWNAMPGIRSPGGVGLVLSQWAPTRLRVVGPETVDPRRVKGEAAA
jgi:hypothetical protein